MSRTRADVGEAGRKRYEEASAASINRSRGNLREGASKSLTRCCLKRHYPTQRSEEAQSLGPSGGALDRCVLVLWVQSYPRIQHRAFPFFFAVGGAGSGLGSGSRYAARSCKANRQFERPWVREILRDSGDRIFDPAFSHPWISTRSRVPGARRKLRVRKRAPCLPRPLSERWFVPTKEGAGCRTRWGCERGFPSLHAEVDR